VKGSEISDPQILKGSGFMNSEVKDLNQTFLLAIFTIY